MSSPYDLKFGKPYVQSTTYDLNFRKDDGGVGANLRLTGHVFIPDDITLSGEMTAFPRPQMVLGGTIQVDQTLSVSGVLRPYSTLRIVSPGLDVTQTIHISGQLEWETAFSLGGRIELPTGLTVTGSLKYDEDVFRGFKSEIQVNSTYAKRLPFKNVTGYFKSSANVYVETGEEFRGGTKLGYSIPEYYRSMVAVRQANEVGYTSGIRVLFALLSLYDDSIRLRKGYSCLSAVAVSLNGFLVEGYFIDMVRLRTEVEGPSTDAVPTAFDSSDHYRLGVPLRAHTLSFWREAVKVVSVFKRRPVIPPIYKPPALEDFNLRFNCAYRAVQRGGDYNLYFNMSRCKRPYIIPPNGSYIVENTFSAKRLADNQPFDVYSASIDTDASSWCWSGSFSIPAHQLEYVKAVPGQLPLVELTINGDRYNLLVESFNRSRRFNEDTYTVKGRSISALLDEPHSAPISYTNTRDISAVQLIQQLVADTVGDTLTVVWEDLVSDIGWVLSAESVSLSGQSVIKAIASIVEPVGGVVFTHPNQPTLIIKKAYPYAHWETPLVIDHTLAEDVVEDMGTSWDRTLSKNGVYVTDPISGNTAKVYRRGTSGNILDTEINSPVLSTHSAREAAGKHSLIKANTAENKNLSFPFLPQMHHLYPCDVMCITTAEGSDWGTIFSVGLSVSVSQDGFIDVGYTVTVKKFMETGLYG